MGSIEHQIEEFKHAFYACQFSEMCSLHKLFLDAIEENPKTLRKLDFPEYSRFKDELEYTELCISFLDSADWSVVSDSNGIRVESRGGGNEFYTRCFVDIDSSLFKVLSVLSEPDLVTTWYELHRVDILKQVDIYATPTITRKLTKYHFWFPWPVSDRHCILDFNAVPLPSRKATLITMKTPTSENYLNMKIPALAKDEVRMWVRVGCLYAEYVDVNKTRVIFMINSDMNIV